MKLFALIIAAVALLALGAAQAFAHTTHGQSAKVVTVAMHDPGCHWFFAAGTFRKSLTAKGPVVLLNQDEAALKVVGPTGVRRDPVGKVVTCVSRAGDSGSWGRPHGRLRAFR